MPESGFNSFRHSSLSWLFWLAMLLPMAQSAAARHGYLHLQPSAGGHEEGKLAPHSAQCDLCLTASAERALSEGQADLIAFARSFLANPDLVQRMRANAPLTAPDMATFYTPGPRGYTDYPMRAGASAM